MANVLITGSSSGIGLATALMLAKAGHNVLATMRDTGRGAELKDAASRDGLPISIRTLDVNSDESVRACFNGIPDAIDVLVNNAGVECIGSIEEVPIEAFIGTMNTNYFGAVRCMKAVIPRMREARNGCIINVTSVAGRISNSPLGPYAASKFALEAISEAVAGELKPFNIRVAIVEPGIQDTRMARSVVTPPSSAYPHCRRFAGLFRAALSHPVPPETTSTVIREIIESGTWQLRHTSGPDAAPLLGWRASMTDEQWVDCNALDDNAWYEKIQNELGLDARPEAQAAQGSN